MSTLSSALSHPYLLGGGACLLLLGWWLWRWSSRHDLKGLAVDAAWQIAKARGDLSTRTDLGDRLRDVTEDRSNVGRAGKVAGYAAWHVLAQIAGMAGVVAMLAGLALVTAAFFI